MLLRAASVILINAEKRRLVEVLPDSVKEALKEWEVQVLILVSLTLQIVLILLGKRRQFVGRLWIRITLWIAYLLADWVATVALGGISQDTLDKCPKKSDDANRKDELMSFWAPFMLLHLGGPDTITAYSLEDNELWLRHLVGLIMQSGLVLYILLVALPGSSWLPILSLPVLISGLIKYCERTWALRSAKMGNLRDSILTPPDPGPNYAKFMEEFNLKKAEGYFVMADEVKEISVPIDHSHQIGTDKLRLVSEAYDQFQTFNRLFVDLILSFQDRDNSQSYFQKLKPKEAFDVIEAELGFAYDTFYTKEPVIHTALGCILRAVTFSCTCFSLISFSLLRDKSNYHTLDLILTYMLLVVAFLLEIYALISLLKSDLTQIWLSKDKHDGNFHQFLLRKLCLQNNNINNSNSNNNNNNNSNNSNNNNNIPDANPQVGSGEGEITPSSKMRWSNCTPQYNLLRYCLVFEPAPCFRLQKLFLINEILEKHRYTKYEKVSPHLKALIFNHFRKFAVGSNEPDPTALCKRRGSVSLNENACVSLVWSTEVEFDQSILIWHIATDLCYHLENNTDESTRSKHSKQLSDYMLYLLVVCPFMLPIGIGMIRFRDTCAEAKEFFKGRKLGKDMAKACNKLLAVSTDVAPAKVKGDRSKSVLFDACVLAKALQEKEQEHKWKIISEVWVEILAYAATHCRGNHHAHQLRKGGELLTHVWLLMAHLGITEQFQIYRGHARAKLIVK